MKKYILLAICAVVSVVAVAQQEGDTLGKPKKYEFRAYLNFLQSNVLDSVWITSNLLHNRMMFKWFPFENFTFDIEARTRLMYGDDVRFNPSLAHDLDQKTGFFDLSVAFGNSRAWVATSVIDRLYVDYTIRNVQFTLGRQRINWGRCVAFNPNDLFNVSSYYDVDYIESAGSDALRLQLYTGVASKLELAAKLDNKDRVTAAGLVKFNKFNYDFQVLGGVMNEEDYVAGLGWEGYIKSISFRGEASYFHAIENALDTSGYFIGALGVDYSTPDNLFLQLEMIYSGYAKEHTFAKTILENPSLLLSSGGGGVFNAKTVTTDKFTVFAGSRYSITPLIGLGLSGMYYVDNTGFFINPSVTISLKENLDFQFLVQYFNIEVLNTRQDAIIAYWSIKQSF